MQICLTALLFLYESKVFRLDDVKYVNINRNEIAERGKVNKSHT